jgi:hypothetical protein
MKIFNKISFFLSLLVLFSFNANNAFAATAEATVYKVTVYRLVFCENGSTLANCSNPDEVEYRADGLVMDIASVNAGAVAGSFGNLTKLKFGKTYSHGEVILSRSFVMAGAGLSPNGTECQTSDTSGNAGTKTALGKGEAGTATNEEQTLVIKNADDLSTNINGTTAADGTGTDGDDGEATSSHDYVKFRWAFTSPFTMGNKIPTMLISFDVSAAMGFYNNTCTNAGISSEAPTITNTFVGG